MSKAIDSAWQWRELVSNAEQQDRLRWHSYASNHTPDDPQRFIDVISKKAAWLNKQWGVTGDVNLDGNITAADVTAIYDNLLNGDHHYLLGADINNDGNITAADVTALYGILLSQ